MTKQIRKLKKEHINFYRSKTGNLCYVVEHDDEINLKTIYNHTLQVKVVTDNNYRCRAPKFSYSIHDTGNLNYRRYKKALNTMYQPDFSNPVTDIEKEEVLLGYQLLKEKELAESMELQRRRRIHMIGCDASHLVTHESQQEEINRLREKSIWFGDIPSNGFKAGELSIVPTTSSGDASYKTSIG